MKRIIVLSSFTLACWVQAEAQVLQNPKPPVSVPAGTAQAYINNYKNNTLNYFAYGYLLDITTVKAMSPVAVRVYNGLTSDSIQKMAIVPLNSNFGVMTNAPCKMASDDRLCPRACDIDGVSSLAQVSQATGTEVSNTVNTCMECRMYESANAIVVFTSTLQTLATAGFTYVRIYNGMDAGNKRYVVYVPVDNTGREVMLANLFVGDYNSVLSNCKYP